MTESAGSSSHGIARVGATEATRTWCTQGDDSSMWPRVKNLCFLPLSSICLLTPWAILQASVSTSVKQAGKTIIKSYQTT
jgi:hypothetical protein